MTVTIALLSLSVGPWTAVARANIATVENDVLRIDNSGQSESNQFASAHRQLKFSNGGPWQVSYIFKYGVLRPGGVSITLRRDARESVWIGADAYYGAMTLFRGTEQLWSRKADSEWHSMLIWSNTSITRIYLDGILISTVNGSPMPNSLTVETRSSNVGKQSELTVANVRAFNSGQPNFQLFGE